MNNVARRIATIVAALTVSLGVVAVATPAHAMDTSWGQVKAPTPSR